MMWSDGEGGGCCSSMCPPQPWRTEKLEEVTKAVGCAYDFDEIIEFHVYGDDSGVVVDGIAMKW